MGAHGVASGVDARVHTSLNPPSPPTLLRNGGAAAERFHR